eukprot:gene18968-2548_t
MRARGAVAVAALLPPRGVEGRHGEGAAWATAMPPARHAAPLPGPATSCKGATSSKGVTPCWPAAPLLLFPFLRFIAHTARAMPPRHPGAVALLVITIMLLPLPLLLLLPLRPRPAADAARRPAPPRSAATGGCAQYTYEGARPIVAAPAPRVGGARTGPATAPPP